MTTQSTPLVLQVLVLVLVVRHYRLLQQVAANHSTNNQVVDNKPGLSPGFFTA
jgi:hypothetical protein